MSIQSFLASERGSSLVKFAVLLEVAAVVLLTFLSSVEAGTPAF
jgi:Flp pilus assembly pilin Flp